MFPSCGYFSSFPCPFYVNGLCERPYCHFRHSKHDVEKAKEEAPCYTAEDTGHSTTTSTSQPSSPVDSTLSSSATNPEPALIVADDVYFTSASEEKTLPPPPTLSQEPEPDSFSIPSFTDNSSKYQVPIAEEPEQYVTASPEKTQPETGPPALPTYLPTPKTPSLPAPEPGDFGVPVYQPTPKRELKRRHGDHVKGKAKATNIEYDPECNYSCGGLTNSSHESTERDDEHAYQPTKKKARKSLSNKRKLRLSCDSLMASSPDLLSQSGDDVPEAQFSEEECDEKETAGKAKDNSMEVEPENFENIGDDDISSDDEFVDVPEVPPLKTNMKNEKMAKASHSSSEKTTKTSSGEKPDPVTSSHSSLAKQQQKQTSKDSSSKTSGSKQSSSSSSKESVVSKTDKSSSHNGTTSGKVLKHDGSKPSSSSAKSSSSSKSLSGDKTHHSTKQSSTKVSSKQKQEHNSKFKEQKSESAHSSESPEKRSKSSSSSSSSNKHSSSSKKSSSSDTKSSSSKQTLSKSDAVRRSSLDSKTSDARQSTSTSKDTQSNSVGRQSLSQSNISRKHSNSESKSGSLKHSSDVRSQADSASASSSSGSKRTSSDSKSTKTSSIGSYSKSSESDGKSSIIKNASSEKSSRVCKKGDSERTSNEQKLHRRHSSSSSTSKHTESHEKAQKPTSSSHDKKSSSKKSSSKDSSRKKLERLNSNLFGDDSDDNNEDFSVSGINCDNSGESSFEEPSTSKAAEEEMEVDYSNFIHDSDFEEEDTFDECLRIFKEEAPKKSTSNPEKKLVKDLKAESSSQHGAVEEVPGKKRTAHKLAEKVRKPELLRKERPRKILSATEVMHNRIMEMQRRALEKAANQVLQEQEVSSTSGSASTSRPGLGGEKKRVAHMPKPPPPAPKPKSFSMKSDGKGILNKAGSEPEKRMAHTPNLVNLKRPVIPASFGSKVPSNIRQRYLNLIIDECLKFCPDQEKAFKKGLEEETGVYDRASNKNIYLRVAVNAITRLRAEAKEAMPGSSKSQQSRSSLTQSHEATIGGSRAAKTSFTLHRSNSSGKKVEVPLTAVELYQKLMKYTMTEEQLVENGYPLPSPDTPGKAVISGSRYQATDTLIKANERNCARCGTRFIVNADGEYAHSEDCVYHWSRAYPRKKSGFIQHIYNCCGSDTSSKGCQVAANHVHDRNKRDSLTGFMRTMPRSPPRDGNFGIYALDCEMVYTLGGLELARVTVIDVEGETVYESLVQPFTAIVDFNTRFSGLKAEDLKDVKTTLTDVQAILLSRFSDKTILIGHSLESDLFALKLIHKTVVDTSVVFPHRLGPPYKRALKNLMLETFQKIIQCDDGGHDSKEDAMACLQLMKWRLKEDSRREQRYS